jgi:hypothetical protein
MYKRWQRALQIAKILFEQEGYHTRYLQEIEDFLHRTCDTTGRVLNGQDLHRQAHEERC